MNKNRNLLVVVCVSAGSGKDPKRQLTKALATAKISYKTVILKNPPEVSAYVKKHASEYETVAVYGGDGTVVAAIKALAGEQKTKLLILPGGTANIAASGLNIPLLAEMSLRMYIEGAFVVRNFDLASVGDELLALDMHTGWWTKAIAQTPRSLKRKLGPLAYGLSAIRALPSAKPEEFELVIAGKKKRSRGYALYFANQGAQNFLGVPVFSRPHTWGYVQVAVVKTLSPVKLFVWLLAKVFLRINVSSFVRQYRTSELTINSSLDEVMFDDSTTKLKTPLKVVAATSSVRVIAPAESSAPTRFRHVRLLKLLAHRLAERIRNYTTGKPSIRYTRVSPRLYVGGAYRSRAYTDFKRYGITGVVSMRQKQPPVGPGFLEVLHLKTQDWHAPTLKALASGVQFIQRHIDAGGAVYVHCRQGEGRGPTMAAAYLISQGYTAKEAVAHILKFRPIVHPSRAQMRRLAEWQEHCAK